MEQTRLVEKEPTPVYLRYKGIQDNDIIERTFDTDPEVRNVISVIKGLNRQTKSSSLKMDLNLDSNPEMWISNLLDNYPDPPMFDTSLINNFCDSLYTSARQSGKYAVLLVAANSIIICHTDSKERTITTDADVIERLLDTDNVDKYVQFKRERDGITAHHFERNQNTKSFSEWLGLRPDEIAFEEAGDVKIYCRQKDSRCIFQYDRDEFVKKFLLEETHTLISGLLRFPDGDEFPVSQVKLGRRTYDTVDEFKQSFYNIYYDLQTYRTKYADLTESLEAWQVDIIDYDSKVMKGINGDVVVRKEHNNLNIVFADKLVELAAEWRLELLSQFINGEEIRLYHVGSDFSEEPYTLGPYMIYNNDGGNNFDRLNDLYQIVSNFKSGDRMANIISYIIFDTASKWLNGPEGYLFRQLGEKCAQNMNAQGVVTVEEGSIIEYKSRDWFSADGTEKLADKITKEIQNGTTLLIGGIEDGQDMQPIARNRFDPDRDDNIREALLQRNGNHSTINFTTLPLGKDGCLALILGVKEDSEFDFDVLESAT